MLERILMSTMGDSTLPLGDTSLLGQYQFSKRKREGKNEKEDGKRKKAEPRTKKGKGEWQKKVEEADVPNKKKKVEDPKKEAFTDEQFDHVSLIQLKSLSPKIAKKGLDNRVPRKRLVMPGEILEVVNDLMVDDDVEVGREVNFNAISSEYGGDLLEWKKGDEKDNDDKKDDEEKVKSEEGQPQVAEEEEVREYVYPILQMEESKNGDEKVNDVEKDGEEKESEEEQPQVVEEEDSEQPIVGVYYTGKKDIQH
ncbi:hypothetical protein GIB67_027214, partial [Kingdonia uniflora]